MQIRIVYISSIKDGKVIALKKINQGRQIGSCLRPISYYVRNKFNYRWCREDTFEIWTSNAILCKDQKCLIRGLVWFLSKYFIKRPLNPLKYVILNIIMVQTSDVCKQTELVHFQQPQCESIFVFHLKNVCVQQTTIKSVKCIAKPTLIGRPTFCCILSYSSFQFPRRMLANMKRALKSPYFCNRPISE